MLRALTLARKGVGLTSPNPAVGCVIVHKGKVVAEGWHQKAGGAHAEIVAIKKFGKLGLKGRGCEMYVTLEPCCHVGKTDPCTDAIIKTGFRRVIIGMSDPYPKVNGEGAKILRKAGVKIEFLGQSSDIKRQIAEINQPFLKWVSTALPYVVLKAGMSLDGKIATADGESKWITSSAAREDARIERGKYDAVLVGAGTVRADDCELAGSFEKRPNTASTSSPLRRLTGSKASSGAPSFLVLERFSKLPKHKKLLRIIIDKDLSLPITKKVFRDEHVFVACTGLASEKNRQKFLKAGIDFKSFGKSRIDIDRMLVYFGQWGVQSIFVEGGAKIHGAFFDSGNFDKILFYIAPKIIGGEQSPSVIGGLGIKKLSESVELRELNCEKIGKDLKISAVKNFYS